MATFGDLRDQTNTKSTESTASTGVPPVHEYHKYRSTSGYQWVPVGIRSIKKTKTKSAVLIPDNSH